MSDVLSFAEIDGQQVELLPARTLLQTPTGGGSGGGSGDDASGALGLVFSTLLSKSNTTPEPLAGLVGGGA